MRRGTILVALAILGMGVTSANTAPLADAGLDQQVERGATVYLDAGGSTDPDGTLTNYEWTITAPNGTDLEPDCRTCARTEFAPDRTGQYEATVAVTDDDGATTEDTLFVTVEQATPPSVTVSGPGGGPAGEDRTYRAEATAGDADLSTVTWRVDGTYHSRTAVDGEDAVVTEELSLSPGEHSVEATVIDSSGKRSSDERSVRITSTGGGNTGGNPGGGGGGGGCSGGCSEGTNDGDGDEQALLTFDSDTGEWDVNNDLASRTSESIEIAGKKLSTKELENIDSSAELVRRLRLNGITESEAIDRAMTQENRPADGEATIGLYDPYTGSGGVETEDDVTDTDDNSNSGDDSAGGSDGTGTFTGGYTSGGSSDGGSSGGSDGSGTFTGGYTGGGTSNGRSFGGGTTGGYNGGGSYTGGGGYGF